MAAPAEAVRERFFDKKGVSSKPNGTFFQLAGVLA
jgi:hypothetical protein